MEKIPTYVISLDQAKEKYKRVEKDFSAIGIPVKRFSGVYAKAQPKEYIKSVIHPYVLYTIENGRRIDPEICTLGAVGCYLSHIGLWKQLLNSGEEMMHVVEDDARILSTTEKMEMFVKSVPSDWDVIYLGFMKTPLYSRRDILVSDGLYKINSWTFQTHSYVINRRGAEKLLSKALPIVHHVDSYMSFMAINGGLVAYRPSKQMIGQNLTLNSQVGHGVLSMDEALIVITRFPPSVIILSLLISLFVVVSFLIKRVAKLVR